MWLSAIWGSMAIEMHYVCLPLGTLGIVFSLTFIAFNGSILHVLVCVILVPLVVCCFMIHYFHHVVHQPFVISRPLKRHFLIEIKIRK